MAQESPSAVLVTVLFALVAAWNLARLAIGYSWVDRLSNGVHLVMAGTMLLMPWAAYGHLPASAQIVFFTAAALWYVYLALFVPHAQAGPGEGHHDGPALLWYHAGMMAAMVWMAVAMSPVPGVAMAGADGGSKHGMAGMPGMSMGDASSGGADSAMMMTGSAHWAVVISWVLGVLLGVAAVWFLVRLIRQAIAADEFRGRPLIRVVDSLANVLMAAGMGAAFVFLMT